MNAYYPKNDISKHTALEHEESYDVQILFKNGTNQSWCGLTSGAVEWLCEKYQPYSTPLSVILAKKFLPSRRREQPHFKIRRN